MAKALTYLRQRDFAKTVETLKGFEKKDSKMAATASANLSFLYFLVSNYIASTECMLYIVHTGGDLKQAEKYADLVMSTDRYNPYGNTYITICMYICMCILYYIIYVHMYIYVCMYVRM